MAPDKGVRAPYVAAPQLIIHVEVQYSLTLLTTQTGGCGDGFS